MTLGVGDISEGLRQVGCLPTATLPFPLHGFCFYQLPQANIGVDEFSGGDSGFSKLLQHPWLRLFFIPNSPS